MTTASRRRAAVSLGLLVLSFLGAQACFALLPSLFEPWNSLAIDQLFRGRDAVPALRVPYDPRVVHVDLNMRSIHELENFYPGRSQHAQVIRNLARMGVAAQLYDFVFPAPASREDDRALVRAAREAGTLYVGMAFSLDARSPGAEHAPRAQDVDYLARSAWALRVDGDARGFYEGTNPILTFAPLREAARGLGYLNVTQDRDGVFRRIPLLVRHRDRLHPSIVLLVTCHVLGVSPDRIEVRPGESITLRGARSRAGDPPRDLAIPIDARGAMIVNYVGPWERTTHYDFADVLRASAEPERLARWRQELGGRIAVVSEVATGASDVGPVPTDSRFPLSGIHANAIHTILTQRFLVEAPASATLAIELALAVAIALLATRLAAIPFSLGMLSLAALYVIAVAAAFLAGGVILNAVRPLFLIGFSLVSIAGYRYGQEEKEKHAIRTSFEAYFPPTVVERIIDGPEFITDTAQKKELTILFSDVESFTRHSARMPPDELRRFLNEYFAEMTDIVFRWGGTLDKFIGDGLMVFFGDPQSQPDHALRAVRAAQDMQRRIRELRPHWLEEHGMPVRVRIGINTGTAVVGNLGSRRRLSYTVLGAAVNLAQRLEANAPADRILVARRTRELVGDAIPMQRPEPIRAKGFDEPVEVYEAPVDAETRG